MTKPQVTSDAAHEIERVYRAHSPKKFLLFMHGLTIASTPVPTVFANCMADFQDDCFNELAPSIEAVRNGTMPPIQRFWIERTKKASKDADLAAMLLWLLAFPVKPIYLQIGAADRDQASIVKSRMLDLLHYNPWLKRFVDVHTWKIVHKGGLAELDIMSADIAGAHGATPDVLVINELSHVTKWEFVENLLDNADGVPTGVVIIATNAGFKGTKAEVLRNNALESDQWTTHIWARPAPWHNEKFVADARRRSLASRYNRLWWGKWASGKGDALSEDDIDRCFANNLEPLDEPEEGWLYIAGLDLGHKHDHSGLIVLGVKSDEQLLRVAWLRGWAPADQRGRVDLATVEETCFWAYDKYRIQWFGYDPTEARLMAQQLQRRGVPMQEVSFQSTANLTAMAQALVQVVEAGKLQCFDDDEGRLRRDFGKFNIVEKTYGFRLEATRDEHGHADVGTALCISLPRAVEMLRGYSGLAPDDELFVDISEEEEQKIELPSDLAEIVQAVEDDAEDRGTLGGDYYGDLFTDRFLG